MDLTDEARAFFARAVSNGTTLMTGADQYRALASESARLAVSARALAGRAAAGGDQFECSKTRQDCLQSIGVMWND